MWSADRVRARWKADLAVGVAFWAQWCLDSSETHSSIQQAAYLQRAGLPVESANYGQQIRAEKGFPNNNKRPINIATNRRPLLRFQHKWTDDQLIWVAGSGRSCSASAWVVGVEASGAAMLVMTDCSISSRVVMLF